MVAAAHPLLGGSSVDWRRIVAELAKNRRLITTLECRSGPVSLPFEITLDRLAVGRKFVIFTGFRKSRCWPA